MFLKSNSFIVGSLVGALLAAVLVVLLTVVGELFSPLKNFLKDAHHHHWVGKGVWAGILFAATTFILYISNRNSSEHIGIEVALRWLSYVLIFGTVILFAFFIYEYGAHH